MAPEFLANLPTVLLTIATFIAGANSARVHLGILEFPIPYWLILKISSPAIFLYTFATLFKILSLRITASVLFFRFGTIYLFWHPWTTKSNLMMHYGHLCMTFCIFDTIRAIYLEYSKLRVKKLSKEELKRTISYGLGLGIFVCVVHVYANGYIKEYERLYVNELLEKAQKFFNKV